MNQDDFKRIQQTLQRLTTIVEQLTEGVAVTDLSGMIHFANPAIARMHGYDSCRELIGKKITGFYSDEQSQTDFKSMIDAVRDSGQVLKRIRHTRKNGSTFPALAKWVLLKDETGHVVGLIVLITDLSPWTQQEESLTGHIEQMESANDQLSQQICELEQALETNSLQLEPFGPDDPFSQPLSIRRQLAGAKRHQSQKQPSNTHTVADKQGFKKEQLSELAELAKRLRR